MVEENSECSVAINSRGFMEIIPKPTLEQLRVYYASHYYQEAQGSYEMSYSPEELSWILGKIKLRRLFVEQYLTRIGESHKTLLDVGAGEGFGMAEFLKSGWLVRGLDYSSYGVSSHNPDVFPFLRTGDIYELLEEELMNQTPPTCVLLQNVLEHVLDPDQLLKLLHQILTRDPERHGILVVVVPNDFSDFQSRLRKLGHIQSDYWVSPPEHLSYFNRHNLNAFMKDSGFKKEAEIGDAPVEVFLLNEVSNYRSDPTVGKAAHRARIDLETFVNNSDWAKAFRYWESSLEVGLARNIVGFYSPATT